ncbi:MAG: DUF1579 family protein [Candidatus Cybelea sp.]
MKGLAWRSALVLSAAGLVALPIRGAAAPLDELDRFAGTWQSSGTFVDGPYSKAGTTTATTTCAWSTGRAFMICQQSVSMDGKMTYGLGVYTYDETASAYRFYNVQTGQTTSSTITVAGNTITYPFSFTDNGKNVAIRTLNVWDSPSVYRWRSEYSTDGGMNWKLMGSGSSQRQ